MTSGGNNFNYFPENQLAKFKVCPANFLIFVPPRISVTHFATLWVPLDALAWQGGSCTLVSLGGVGDKSDDRQGDESRAAVAAAAGQASTLSVGQ